MQIVEKNANRYADRRGAEPLNFRLGENCRVKGELHLSGNSEIHGQVEGIIRSSGELHIASAAIVGAQVYAETLRISGSVVGEIECSVKLELLRGARVAGNITTPALVVEDGVQYEGRCKMPEEEDGIEPIQGNELFELTNPLVEPE